MEMREGFPFAVLGYQCPSGDTHQTDLMQTNECHFSFYVFQIMPWIRARGTANISTLIHIRNCVCLLNNKAKRSDLTIRITGNDEMEWVVLYLKPRICLHVKRITQWYCFSHCNLVIAWLTRFQTRLSFASDDFSLYGLFFLTLWERFSFLNLLCFIVLG